jgi:hypothetical protein
VYWWLRNGSPPGIDVCLQRIHFTDPLLGQLKQPLSCLIMGIQSCGCLLRLVGESLLDCV